MTLYGEHDNVCEDGLEYYKCSYHKYGPEITLRDVTFVYEE